MFNNNIYFTSILFAPLASDIERGCMGVSKCLGKDFLSKSQVGSLDLSFEMSSKSTSGYNSQIDFGFFFIYNRYKIGL